MEKAGSTKVGKVYEAATGQNFKAPFGYTLVMGEGNHHLRKPMMIDEIQDDDQSEMVWEIPEPPHAQPQNPSIPGNEKKPEHALKGN